MNVYMDHCLFCLFSFHMRFEIGHILTKNGVYRRPLYVDKMCVVLAWFEDNWPWNGL